MREAEEIVTIGAQVINGLYRDWALSVMRNILRNIDLEYPDAHTF